MLHLLQQNLLLPQQIVRPRLEESPLVIDRAAFSHVLKPKNYAAIVPVGCRGDVQDKNTTSNSWEAMGKNPSMAERRRNARSSTVLKAGISHAPRSNRNKGRL